ncbi:DUF1996 domain-containing protein [Erythrobacter litoralis]
MFFGNTALNAFTTSESILTTGLSSCEGGTNYAVGGWIPALYNSGGQVVVPEEIFVYYKTFGSPSMNYGMVQEVPLGLQMLASPDTLHFDEGLIRVQNFPHNGFSALVLNITFPSCVATDNGQITGNPILSHRDMPGNLANQVNSHVSYPSLGNEVDCPASHPYRFPTPQFLIFFDTNETGNEPYLSSDAMADAPPMSTLHGDYMFGAEPSANRAILRCVQEARSCGFDEGGRAQLPDRFFGPSGQMYRDSVSLLDETDRTPFGSELPPMRSGGAVGHQGHGDH